MKDWWLDEWEWVTAVVVCFALIGGVIFFAVWMDARGYAQDKQSCMRMAGETNQGEPVYVGRWTCIGTKKAEGAK